MYPVEGRGKMEKNFIRLLKADEIECRVSVINEKGLSLLYLEYIYKYFYFIGSFVNLLLRFLEHGIPEKV